MILDMIRFYYAGSFEESTMRSLTVLTFTMFF